MESVRKGWRTNVINSLKSWYISISRVFRDKIHYVQWNSVINVFCHNPVTYPHSQTTLCCESSCLNNLSFWWYMVMQLFTAEIESMLQVVKRDLLQCIQKWYPSVKLNICMLNVHTPQIFEHGCLFRNNLPAWKWNIWSFRLWFCTVRLYWARDKLG